MACRKVSTIRIQKRPSLDFLRRGSTREDPVFTMVNKFRAVEDLNRWAIRHEIEPQLRQWLSDHPLLQPSGDHPQLAPAVCEAASATLCEPQAWSKRTASWKPPRTSTAPVPLCPTLGIKQPNPQLLVHIYREHI